MDFGVPYDTAKNTGENVKNAAFGMQLAMQAMQKDGLNGLTQLLSDPAAAAVLNGKKKK